MSAHHTNEEQNCKTCGAPLAGKFCHQCGEKRFNPEHDFSVLHFLEETFESFTHLDSKLIRTFWAALVKPGFLAAEFVAGRRVRYMKPIPFFLLTGLLFYIFFPTASSFYANPGDMNAGYQTGNWLSNSFHFDTPDLIAQKAAALKMEPDVFIKSLRKDNAAPKAKAFLFLIIPFWGLILWLFFHRKIPWLTPHLIFALYGLAFFILFDLIFLSIMVYGLHMDRIGDDYVLFLIGVMSLWCALAIRRVYRVRVWVAALSGFPIAMSFFVLFNYYRQFITLWALWSY